MTKRIRLLIADDHLATREAIKTLLQSDPTIQIVGEVKSIAELIDQLTKLKPHALLLDLKWGGSELAGLKALERIRASRIPVKVILHTAHPKLLEGDHRVALADGIALNSMSEQALLAEIYNTTKSASKGSQQSQFPLFTFIALSSSLFILMGILAFLVIQIGIEPLKAIVYFAILLFIIIIMVFFAYIGKIKSRDFMSIVRKIITKIT